MTPGWDASEVVRRHAHARGSEVALVHGEAIVTWSELDRRCDEVGRDLRAAGVPAGGLVALAGETTVDAVAGILGVVRAGAVAAPLPGGLTSAERAAALAVLDPVLVIGGGAGAAAAGRTLDGAGVVVLTSGTTARPKGVVLSAAALAASADAWLASLPPATGWLLALGLGHVAGLGVLWRAVAAGVPLRLADAADTDAQLEALRGSPPVSHVSLVPAQLARLLDASAGTTPPAALRAVLLGGGTIPTSLVVRALEAGWPVVPTYGLSEAGSGVTALPAAEAADAPASAGRPLPGVSVTIDEPGADGVGEILVSTPARFDGYLEEPRPAGPAPEAPIRTGDLGRLDAEGRLFVFDRRTDRIVRGGENVSPAEVESVLLAMPSIVDAAVVARADPLLGQVPLAATVLGAGAADPGDEAILRACRASLAGFKVPAAIVRLDALPRTTGGKLRRDAVRALVDGGSSGILARPDGDEIGWRVTGSGDVPVVLLPGTLSTAAQLDRLAAELAGPGDVTVHAIDRRGMGSSRLADPRPLDVDVHVRDLVAYLDARHVHAAVLVGVSFGGVVALEAAARHPGRALTVVAWEPPYGAVADPATRARFADLAGEAQAAHRRTGAPAAAEVFLRAVAGDAAWDRLPERARATLGREGDGALADSALLGLDPAGLARIDVPVTLLTGGGSEPFYRPIADALAGRIRGAGRRDLDGLAHPAPITEPHIVGPAIREAIAGATVLPPSSPSPAPALESRP